MRLLVAFGIFAFFALSILGLTSFEVVSPGNRGVSVTLGKVNPQFLGEGLHWKTPFIESIDEVMVKQRTASGKTMCFSSDLQNIEVTFSVLYSLPEGKVVKLYQGYAGDPLEALVIPRLHEALKQSTSSHRAEELVKNRDGLKAIALEKLQKSLGGDGLLTINDLTINDLGLSNDLEKAIEQKTIREQEALAKNFELEKAQKQALITQVEAEAEARAVKIKGDALRSSPEVIQLEIAKKWNGVSPQTVVTGSGASVILPMNK